MLSVACLLGDVDQSHLGHLSLSPWAGLVFKAAKVVFVYKKVDIWILRWEGLHIANVSLLQLVSNVCQGQKDELQCIP